MRKSRSRRKNERPQSSPGQVSAPAPERTEMTISPTNVESNTALRRRNVTPEEAALTAKNYRLAKELVSVKSVCSDGFLYLGPFTSPLGT